jgi:hypothetical protein
MASAIKNQPSAANATVVTSLVTKLTRGFPAKLGSVTASGDVVAFALPEPSRDHQGFLIIQAVGGTTPTFALEVSIDGAATWAVVPVAAGPGAGSITLTLTGQPGGDTAAAFMAQYNVSGFGAGAQFRFGRTDANGGASAVWALVG